MGLFSRSKAKSKTSVEPIEIPEDILADVTVNGVKVVKETPTQSFAANTNASSGLGGTSPFLKSKSTQSVPSETPTPFPSPAPTSTPPPTPTPQEGPKDEPRPFKFSDQHLVSGEIHFTDIPQAPKTASFQSAAKAVPAKPDFSQITQDQALLNRHKEHLSPLTKMEPAPVKKKNLWSTANILSLVVFILILAFISGGSWYYLHTRSTEEEPVDPSINSMELPEEVLPETPTQKTIAVNQPNYLTFDVETVTREEIINTIQAEGDKMKAEGVTTPVEYLVQDKNANPVAFSRFAILINGDTPRDLVEASLEPFSLYLYQDKGSLRMALAVTLRPGIGTNFPANKGVLPESLKNFFYPEEYQANTYLNTVFSQSSYQGNIISYTNIDEPKNFSFDLSSSEGILTLANSKDMMRAVIDKRNIPVDQE